VPTKPEISDHATEHILEFAMGKHFLDYMSSLSTTYPDPQGSSNRIGLCEYMRLYWNSGRTLVAASSVALPNNYGQRTAPPIQWVARQWPAFASRSPLNNFANEFLVLDEK